MLVWACGKEGCGGLGVKVSEVGSSGVQVVGAGLRRHGSRV